eukprot:5730983-Alexandrium_andersonii.AAC.1
MASKIAASSGKPRRLGPNARRHNAGSKPLGSAFEQSGAPPFGALLQIAPNRSRRSELLIRPA